MLDENAMPYPTLSETEPVVYPNWEYHPLMDYGVVSFADGRTVCVQGDDAADLDLFVADATEIGRAFVRVMLEQFEGVAE